MRNCEILIIKSFIIFVVSITDISPEKVRQKSPAADIILLYNFQQYNNISLSNLKIRFHQYYQKVTLKFDV